MGARISEGIGGNAGGGGAVRRGATTSSAQAGEPTPTLARVGAMAQIARADNGLLGFANELTRDAAKANPSIRALGRRIVAQDDALIALNRAIIKRDARIRADERKLRRDQQKLRDLHGTRSAHSASLDVAALLRQIAALQRQQALDARAAARDAARAALLAESDRLREEASQMRAGAVSSLLSTVVIGAVAIAGAPCK